MEHNILFILGVIFLIAFFNKNISSFLKIPEVTGYVVIGVISSTFLTFFIGRERVDHIIENFHLIPTIALGIIAFTIGIELKLNILKRMGKSIFFIVVWECLGAFISVFAALKIFGFETYKCLLFGAVASATAPAATVAVIKQYKAKGSFTSYILAIVGIDDAMALVIFAFAISFSKALIKGTSVNISDIIISTLVSIFFGVLLGMIFAGLYLLMLKKIRSNDIIQMLLISFILMLLGISEQLHVSELLSIMSFGAILTNFSDVMTLKSEEIIEKFTGVFLGAFFILGGAHLDFLSVGGIIVVGVIYFVSRSFGKIIGASFGANISGSSNIVKKYIGFALLPQVGVGLALALSIKRTFDSKILEAGKEVLVYGDKGSEVSYMILNILLFTTLITEVVGPMLTRYALKKSGEIKD
ncbi:cation:proton antiporter [uncultured Ilyobacter sp.]|uniref:cation:proton antiporter n=1 Tax=uncultured Ilyobacter sp. TaxID=544433 RepID=UPI0029C0F304|nr:cation:proton antiporter [uncultured Ilyobacter sp.]